MGTFGLFKLQLIILISVCNLNEVRGDSLTVLNLLFKGISDRLDTLELSFETRINNAMKEVNTRLVLLENRVGINEPTLERQSNQCVTGPEPGEISLDIKETKRNLLKAMSIEKQIIRESVQECEDKLKDLKTDIIGIVETMNTTMERSNEYLIKKIEQKTKEQRRISSKTSDDLGSVNERINGMDETIKQLLLDQETTSSNVAALNVKQEKTHGFTAFLHGNTQYQYNDVIVFDKVDYNTGSYDVNTGKFTVPKSGTYLFILSVTGTSSNYAYAVVQARKDGILWNGRYVYSEKGNSSTASTAFIYYCEEGTRVMVVSLGDEFHSYRTSFSGVLLD